MRKLAGAAIGLGALLAVAWIWNSEPVQILLGRWSFTQSLSNDRGTYYRLQVKVAYKGEPVAFDIVVGCNVRRIGYKDGSSTVEVGMVPVVFGKRMPDNKGLVVRAPDACGTRYIKEGWIPDDLLPVMVVYDDADTLAFGTAYMSEDAYRNPLSVLRFERATITAATRREFEAFRKQQTNLVSRAAYLRPIMGNRVRDLGLELAVPFGNDCHAYRRFRVPEELREQVRQAWPADRPRYWWPGHKAVFADALEDAAWQRDIGGPFRKRAEWAPAGERPANQGIPRADGRGRIMPPNVRGAGTLVASYYPVYSDNGAHRKMPARYEDWPEHIRSNPNFLGEEIDFREGQTLGFAYCYVAPSATEYSASKELHSATITALSLSPALHRVDGIPVDRAPSRLFETMVNFIERDEYFFNITSFSLEGTGGDV